MKCSKCRGQLEKIQRLGVEVFYHCRACKLPHDATGVALFTTKSLADRYNPLQAARDVIKKQQPGASPVARTSMEVALLQFASEAYLAGVKDGVLLAYSQDFQEGEPMMEKVGVSNEELKAELQKQYNDLKERQTAGLSKEASAGVQGEMEAIKAKLDELNSNP